MLNEQIKQTLNKQTKPFLESQFSRKTSTLRKRSKARSTISIQDIPSYSPSKEISSEQKLTRFQTQQKTQQTGSQNGNSVSCQTNMSVSCFDEPLPDIPPSDPIWLIVIPHEELKGSSVEQLFNQNKEYFYQLLGQYFKEQMKRDFNKNKFNLSTKLKTHSDCDFKFQTPEKLLLIKYSENFKTTQNYQLVQTLYKTHNFEYSSLNYQIKSKKLQFEKIKQQFPKFTISQNNKTGHKLQRNSCPRLSTSLEFQVQTQKNYNKYLIQPQMIEQNKNNQTKLNPILSNEVFFEKQTESYFQYPLHPLPKTTQSYQKQYSAFIKNKGPKIGDVTQMKNWRQSVLKKINQCKSQLQN